VALAAFLFDLAVAAAFVTEILEVLPEYGDELGARRRHDPGADEREHNDRENDAIG
jgi:hypothetical protein